MCLVWLALRSLGLLRALPSHLRIPWGQGYCSVRYQAARTARTGKQQSSKRYRHRQTGAPSPRTVCLFSVSGGAGPQVCAAAASAQNRRSHTSRPHTLEPHSAARRAASPCPIMLALSPTTRTKPIEGVFAFPTHGTMPCMHGRVLRPEAEPQILLH